jgi:hypothetical protein
MKGWKRKVATRQKAEKALASLMRNIVTRTSHVTIFANRDSRGDICILTLFAARRSVCSRGKLLLAVQEVNLRHCFPDIFLKESPSVYSGPRSSYPRNLEHFL